MQTVTEQLAPLLTEVRALRESVVAQEAAAEVYELTSVKGLRFQDQVHALVESYATLHGDLAAQTGDETGASGTKKGDEVVTLNPDDTRGDRLAYTLECKDRRLSARMTHAEVDQAMANRQAAAAVAVFSSQELAPTSAPFSYSGNKAIVVVDKQAPDPYVIQMGRIWARWVTLRTTNRNKRPVPNPEPNWIATAARTLRR